ncbi:MAG TPA: Mrp/NBP35 family ATP-binding protein [Gemmatimonadales bacterium]|nr:Mrp/NBP35 family ATP-binding protein [Gemmatimonadales bacterium]
MSDNPILARVAGALTNIRVPRANTDVISAGLVTDLRVQDDGSVSFTFTLSRDDPASLVREARQAVREVEGVTQVRINVAEPGATGGAAAPPRQAGPPAPPPAPAGLGKVIAVSSGKGGVGKSTIAANVAAALAAQGLAVGVMDADVYGPNIPRMFGVSARPAVAGNRILPLQAHGVKLISLGLLIERDQPAIWRGPIVTKVIQQFLHDVEWGGLDYLIVDMPPGTGDAQLSLAQGIQLAGAVVVTTPQEVAIGDALRSAKMFERVGVPVLGIVENMSYFACPHCGERTEIFLSGGGRRLADEIGAPLLGQVPLQSRMPDLGDSGTPVVVAEPQSPAAQALRGIADELRKRAGRSLSLPILTG